MSLTTFAVIYVDTTLLIAAALPLLILGEAIHRTLCDRSLNQFCQMWDSLEQVEFVPTFNACEVNPTAQELAIIAAAQRSPITCNAHLDELTSRELKALAKQARIKGYGSLNKQSLTRQLEASYCISYAR